jgi:glycosyltransferase involved in cell wall biosynthesis
MRKEVTVSVICLVYNHEKYLARTIESIVSQKTNFSFELVIHDDASTDTSANIIRQYEKQYPEIVKPIYQKENQMSKGIDVFMELCVANSRGCYLAICEGDDYWTDEEKLQRQYDALQQHPEVDLCACSASEVYQEIEVQPIRPRTSDGILTAKEVILGGGRYLATASLFYRRSMVEERMEFEKMLTLDYVIQIRGALRGGIYFLDRNMVVYRRETEGSWTKTVAQNKQKREAHLKLEKAMLRQLDLDTKGRYHTEIEARLRSYVPYVQQLNQQEDVILSALSNLRDGVYLWGFGMRGEAILEFCNLHQITLAGVCDKKNEAIGRKTNFGVEVVHTKQVLQHAKVILASNRTISQWIREQGYQGQIFDFQEYLPLS